MVGRGGGELPFLFLFLFLSFLGWISKSGSSESRSFSGEEGGVEGGGGREEASDGGDEDCFVELELFGEVEAARVGEGSGEDVGSFGGGGREGRKVMGIMESLMVEGGKI